MKKILLRVIIVLIASFYLFIGHEYLKTFKYVYEFDGESITLYQYADLSGLWNVNAQ